MDVKLDEKQLEQVSGGTDDRDGKDKYENIILGTTPPIEAKPQIGVLPRIGVSPEDHNVMLSSTNEE